MLNQYKKSAFSGNRIIYIKDGKIYGECDLGKFEPDDTERTEKLDRFIKEMGW